MIMCLHFSNAAELALEICNSQERREPASSPMEAFLNQLLLVEQERLVHESCAAFGHGSGCRGSLPVGTVEQAMA